MSTENTHALKELTAAIEIIRGEYVVPEGQTADPGEVAWEVRGALTPEELDAWEIAPDLIAAYRAVLVATEEDVLRALHDINIA